MDAARKRAVFHAMGLENNTTYQSVSARTDELQTPIEESVLVLEYAAAWLDALEVLEGMPHGLGRR